MPNLPDLGEEEVEEVKGEIKEPIEEKPKQGDMINFTKEVDYGVIDEEGNRIPCNNLVEAKILSLLLELKGGK